MATRLKPKLLALVLGGAMLLVALLNCAARNDGATSLFRAAAARDLAREERWRLDVQLMDEVGMKIHNNRRFDVPEPFEKRARWVESVAQWYRPADLVQQLVDFRKSVMRDNEPAFRQLVELGLAGDISAKCLAAGLYRHHERTVTDSWKYSFAFVANEAMKARDSGHPVCAAVEASLYLTGEAGYPRDPGRAKPGLVQSALAGMYGSQEFLAGMHLDGSLRQVPADLVLNLCWQRVADVQASVGSLGSTCELYRMGMAPDQDGKAVAPSPEIQRLATQWCEPNRNVTAQTCADLERALVVRWDVDGGPSSSRTSIVSSSIGGEMKNLELGAVASSRMSRSGAGAGR